MKINGKKYLSFCLLLLINSLFIFIIYKKIGISYGINDDVVMRDIANGSRSINPDAHLVYIKYIYGFLLSKLYSFQINIDWYGTLFIVLLTSCLSLLVYKCFTFNISKTKTLCIIVLLYALILPHIVSIQWTLVATLTGCTGVFLLVENNNDSVISDVISFILLLFSFCIRTKVFLICSFVGFFPFIKNRFTRKKIKYIFSLIGIFLLCILLIEVIEYKNYSTIGWKNYFKFNRLRSLLYDYYGIPNYENNIEFYNSHNISYLTYRNLKSYSFIMDKEINIQTLSNLVSYSKSLYLEKSFFEKCISFLFIIKSNMNLTLLAVGCVLSTLFFSIFFLNNKCYDKIFLLVIRMISFFVVCVYIIYSGRFPERILYLLLICYYILIYIPTFKSLHYIRFKYLFLTMLSICMYSLYALNVSLCKQIECSLKNESMIRIKDYVKNDSDNLYIIPSGSFAGFTDNFKFRNNISPSNLIPSGGWLSNSPILIDKLSHFNISDTFKSSENVKYIANTNTDLSVIIDTISLNIDNYSSFECIDSFSVDFGNVYIYKLIN